MPLLQPYWITDHLEAEIRLLHYEHLLTDCFSFQHLHFLLILILPDKIQKMDRFPQDSLHLSPVTIQRIFIIRNLLPYHSNNTSVISPSLPDSAVSDWNLYMHPESHWLQSLTVSLEILPPVQIPALPDSYLLHNS